MIKPFRWDNNGCVRLKRFATPIWLCVAVVLSAQSVSAEKSFEVTGYKDLKFGVSKEEIEAQGFQCGPLGKGDHSNWRGCNSEYSAPHPTIGGLDIRYISLDLRNDRLDSIAMIIMADTHSVKRVFEYNFGVATTAQPIITDEDPEAERLFWVGINGNSYSFGHYPTSTWMGGTTLMIMTDKETAQYLQRNDF